MRTGVAMISEKLVESDEGREWWGDEAGSSEAETGVVVVAVAASSCCDGGEDWFSIGLLFCVSICAIFTSSSTIGSGCSSEIGMDRCGSGGASPETASSSCTTHSSSVISFSTEEVCGREGFCESEKLDVLFCSDAGLGDWCTARALRRGEAALDVWEFVAGDEADACSIDFGRARGDGLARGDCFLEEEASAELRGEGLPDLGEVLRVDSDAEEAEACRKPCCCLFFESF